MDYIRARREVRHALVISDPLPVDSVRTMWSSAGQAATIGIFLLLFGAFLYVGRAILLPILAAAVVALTLAPFVKAAKRLGISPWLTGLVVLLSGCRCDQPLGDRAGRPGQRMDRPRAADRRHASSRSSPCSISRSRHCTNSRNSLLGGRPALGGSAPNVVLPVVAFLTPAAGEFLLFFAPCCFFLVGQIELRNQAVTMFANHDSKLRFLKIMRDIERNLAGYLTVVTIVNIAVGIIVAVGTWLVGSPNPVIFGLIAALC